MEISIESYASTHTGCRKEENEDKFFIEQDKKIFFVADGMGGHEQGELASLIACETIESRTKSYSSKDSNVRLADWLEEAHYNILNHPEGKYSDRRMGTTGVLTAIQGNRVLVAWVGDSRACLYRDGGLIPLSKDHSAVQQMVDSGLITEEQARTHPRRNIITQVLGGNGEPVYPDTQIAHVVPNDILVLFSDGLNEHLDDSTIAKTIKFSASLQDAGDRLVAQVIEDGARDNVTVVLVKIK